MSVTVLYNISGGMLQYHGYGYTGIDNKTKQIHPELSCNVEYKQYMYMLDLSLFRL